MPEQIVLDYDPQPRQRLLHESPARLILYGGAVGGGKSHALRWEAINWAVKVPGIQIYLFRRTLGELEDNHIRQLKEAVPEALAGYTERHKIFQFANSSAIHLCYCEKEKDVERYQGAEIHVLLVDEASHLTEYQLNYLIGRNRLGGFRQRVPEHLRDFLPRTVFASNPGNVGHGFLKLTFIDAAPPESLFWARKWRDRKNPDDKGRLAQFIPAKMKDNYYIDEDYAGSLGGLPPELRQALEEGDWDSVVGQALHTLNREKHMLRAFTPPRTCTHFMSMDWGSAAPFSVGWYFVSDGLILKERENWPERWIPPGAVVRYAEWYGWDGNANHGLRWDARTVAKRIIEIERQRGDPPMDYRVADSSMWNVNDGISIAHNMIEATEGKLGLTRAKRAREHNYQEVLCRLAGAQNYIHKGLEGDYPMLYVTANCQQFWRTVPILTFDSVNPEKGPDTKQEDHCFSAGTPVMTRHGQKPIEQIEQGESVLTTDGWQRCNVLGETRKEEVWKLEFEDGFVCHATPDHQFYRIDGSLARVDELSYNDELWRHSLLAVENFTSADAIGAAPQRKPWVIAFSTARSGLTQTAQFLKAGISTISMATLTTTILKILRSWEFQHTYAIICADPRRSPGPKNIWKRSCAQKPSRGMVPRKAEDGIPSAVGLTDNFRQPTAIFAWNAARAARRNEKTESIAPTPVTRRRSGVKIRAIIPSRRKVPVYCLNVPGPHNFCLANGVFVRNCYDELAYACRSVPFITTEGDRWQEVHSAAMAEAMRGHDGYRSRDPYRTH